MTMRDRRCRRTGGRSCINATPRIPTTNPNRYYFWTATIDPRGEHGGPAVDNSGTHYALETDPERLERAGITWRIYHEKDDYDGDTFDHTSTLRFIEARFGVEVPNLSAWRRATCGDLTSAFGFGTPARYEIPILPDTDTALERAKVACRTLPAPLVPVHQTVPKQEAGTRPRR